MTNLSTIIADNNVLTETSTNTVTNKSIDASQLTGSVAMARLGSGTANNTTFLRGDGTFAVAGLNHFTASESTSAPNDTTTVSALTASGTATNIDLSLIPKGTGALTRDIADNTATGGGKRGIYAVDWQGHRATSTRFASGTYSVIGGGYSNSAYGDYSVTAGGYDNGTGTGGDYAAVVGGRDNTATNYYAIAGGDDCTASAYYSVAFGDTNYATQQAAVAFGERSASDGYYSTAIGHRGDARGRPSSLVLGGENRESSSLSHHTAMQTLAGRTTDASAYTLTGYNNSSIGYASVIESASSYVFRIFVVAQTALSGTDTAGWEFLGLINRPSGGSAAFVGTPTKTAIANTSGASSWDCSLTTTTGAFSVQVTGEASTSIDWTASIFTSEVGA